MRPSPRTVLVVDDEASLRLLCRVNLELEGYRVLEAGTVDAAKRLVAEEPVDVVLLDVHLGATNGLDLVDEIEALELEVAVIVLSGTSAVGEDVRRRVAGVLGKPFTLEELTSSVAGATVR